MLLVLVREWGKFTREVNRSFVEEGMRKVNDTIGVRKKKIKIKKWRRRTRGTRDLKLYEVPSQGPRYEKGLIWVRYSLMLVKVLKIMVDRGRFYTENLRVEYIGYRMYYRDELTDNYTFILERKRVFIWGSSQWELNELLLRYVSQVPFEQI